MAGEQALHADLPFEKVENGISPEQKTAASMAHSLHGQSAAYRRAVTELLFFASIGGQSIIASRCSRVQELGMSEPGCCFLCFCAGSCLI